MFKMLFLLLIIPFAFCYDNVTKQMLPNSFCLLELQYFNTDQFTLLNCYKFGKKSWSSSEWSECTNQCCDPNKVYDQTRSSLETCDNDRWMYELVRFVFILLFFASLALMVTTAVRLCRRNCQNNQENAQQLPQDQIISARRLNGLLSNRNQWTKSAKSLLQDCPICLQLKPNIQFQVCGHFIHRRCWRQWSSKNKTCVVCRSKEVTRVRVYCYFCNQAYKKYVEESLLPFILERCNFCTT